MSKSSLAPIAVGVNPITVTVTGQMTNLSGVRCGNESATTLFWAWGSDSGYLYPSEIDVLIPPVNAPPQIIFTPLSVLPPAQAATSNLLVEFAYAPDDFGGAWPQQLSRLSQAVNTLPVLKVNPADSGIYTLAAGASVSNLMFPLQSAMQTVRVTINLASIGVRWNSASIVGNVTGWLYYTSSQTTTSNVPSDVTFQLLPEDTALLFSLDATPSASPIEYTLTANNFDNVGASAILSANGNPVIVRADATPAQWQVPNNGWNVKVGALAAGASISLVPLTVSQHQYFYESNLDVVGVAGSFGELQDTSANTIFPMNWANTEIHIFNEHGRVRQTGLVLKNTSAVNAAAINGGGNYSQF